MSPDLTERKIEELPYHLQKSRNFVALRELLCDWQVFDRLFTSQHEDDLFKYWAAIEEQARSGGNASHGNDGESDMEMSDTEGKKERQLESLLVTYYMDMLKNRAFPANAVRGAIVLKLANFFQESSHHGKSPRIYFDDFPASLPSSFIDAAEIAFLKAKEYYQLGTQPLEVANVDNALANLYHIQAKHEEAVEILQDTILVYTQQKGESALEVAVTLNKLAQVLMYSKNQSADEGAGAAVAGKNDSMLVGLARAKETLNRAIDICQRNMSIGLEHSVAADIYYTLGCAEFMTRFEPFVALLFDSVSETHSFLFLSP